MVSLIGLLFFSKVWEKIVYCAKGFYFRGVVVREVRCGEQCVAVMSAPSVCHQFATYISSFQVSGLKLTLDVRFPIDRILRENEQGSELDVKLEPCSELDVKLQGIEGLPVRTLRLWGLEAHTAGDDGVERTSIEAASVTTTRCDRSLLYGNRSAKRASEDSERFSPLRTVEPLGLLPFPHYSFYQARSGKTTSIINGTRATITERTL